VSEFCSGNQLVVMENMTSVQYEEIEKALDSDTNADYLFLFCQQIRNLPIILPSHISLYLAIYQIWLLSGSDGSFTVTRRELMLAARINSISTYHKCIKDLSRLKFISYSPTFNYYNGSQIKLL
jgi:hypothetical protein